MNWTGGNLVKFKRKNLGKKAEERVRIEDYIRKRQRVKEMSSLGLEGQQVSINNNSNVAETLDANASLRDRLHQHMSTRTLNGSSIVQNRKPAAEFFKRQPQNDVFL